MKEHTAHTVNAKDYTEGQLNVWADGKVNWEKRNISLKEHFSIVAVDDDVIVAFGDIDKTVYTLVEGVNLKGKTVVPFCTSASSGIGSSAKHLKANANISSKTKWLKGKNFYDASSQKTVDKWIGKLKY